MLRLLTFFTLCILAASQSVAQEGLMVDPEGNVGIGTSTPTAKLEVAGEIKAQSLTLTEPINSVPSGSVLIWLKSTVPEGYMECNGAAINRTDYGDLFTAIGTSYGNGDGSTTFNLPDFRGQFLRGWNNGSGADPGAASRTDRGDGTTGDVIGSKQGYSTARPVGNAFVTNTDSHNHKVNVRDLSGRFEGGSGKTGVDADAKNHNTTTDSHNHSITSGGDVETRPVNLSVMFIIKI